MTTDDLALLSQGAIDTGSIDTVLGSRVRRLRTLRRMSQAELGERLGVTAQQVQKYERGANRIAAATLISIALALEVSPQDLISGLAEAVSPEGLELKAADTPHGHALLEAFRRIEAPEVRAALVTLAAALAKDRA